MKETIMNDYEERIQERFNGYEATLEDGLLSWGKPGDEEKRLYYRIMPNHLCVTDDLDCTVYRVYDEGLCFETFVDWSVERFADTCAASSRGPGAYQYDLGMKVSFHCHMHLRGLQMAMTNLREEATS